MPNAASQPLLELVELPINESGGAFLRGPARSGITSIEHALSAGVADTLASIAKAADFCDRWLFDGPARLAGTLLRFAAIQRRIIRLQRAER